MRNAARFSGSPKREALLRSEVAAMIGRSKLTMTRHPSEHRRLLRLKALFLVTTIIGLTGLWPAIRDDTGATW